MLNVSKSTISSNNGSTSTLEKSISTFAGAAVSSTGTTTFAATGVDCAALFASFFAAPCDFIVGKRMTSCLSFLIPFHYRIPARFFPFQLLGSYESHQRRKAGRQKTAMVSSLSVCLKWINGDPDRDRALQEQAGPVQAPGLPLLQCGFCPLWRPSG